MQAYAALQGACTHLCCTAAAAIGQTRALQKKGNTQEHSSTSLLVRHSLLQPAWYTLLAKGMRRPQTTPQRWPTLHVALHHA